MRTRLLRTSTAWRGLSRMLLYQIRMGHRFAVGSSGVCFAGTGKRRGIRATAVGGAGGEMEEKRNRRRPKRSEATGRAKYGGMQASGRVDPGREDVPLRQGKVSAPLASHRPVLLGQSSRPG